MVYAVDSNCFRVLGNYYPTRFPTLWTEVEALVAAGRFTSVREVRKELDRQNVSVHIDAWAKANSSVFTPPTAEELEAVAAILAIRAFQKLIGEKQRLRGWPVADPFLIARGMVTGAAVVTEENWKQNGAKIPNVCEHFNVDYMTLEELMAEEGWRF